MMSSKTEKDISSLVKLKTNLPNKVAKHDYKIVKTNDEKHFGTNNKISINIKTK